MKNIISTENVDIAIQYAMGDENAFNTLDPGHQNMILASLGDHNSSMLREAMILQYLNYTTYSKKHGMDGYCNITGKQKEVKPTNIVEGQKIASSGNFNDMTSELLEKKDECDVICAGFYEGKFLYIIEIPFVVIKPKLKKQVDRAKLGKRVVCSFSYKDYDHDDINIRYLNEKLIDKSKSLSKKHFDMLKRRKTGEKTATLETFL